MQPELLQLVGIRGVAPSPDPPLQLLVQGDGRGQKPHRVGRDLIHVGAPKVIVRCATTFPPGWAGAWFGGQLVPGAYR